MLIKMTTSKGLTKKQKDDLARETSKLVAKWQHELENRMYAPKMKRSRPLFKFEKSYGKHPHFAIIVELTSYRTKYWPPKIRIEFEDEFKEMLRNKISGVDEIDIYHTDTN